MENQGELTGVSIEESSIRQYNNSKYFASIIGYTGQISQEEYNALSEKEKKSYSLTDIVGKAGIEKSMDSTLQGEKGETRIYVNNVGKVIDSEKVTEAKAGNDVYLSIDADLQVAAYNILEEKLAAILLSKMVNRLDYDRSKVTDADAIVIPVGDVYNAFFKTRLLIQDVSQRVMPGRRRRECWRSIPRMRKLLSVLFFQNCRMKTERPTKICLTECRLIWTTWWIHF